MKAMDISVESDDCVMEACTPAKKKMKQVQLPFQTSNSSKSSDNKNIFKKSKRKTVSPLVGSKNPKIIKLITKENSFKDINEDKEDAEEKEINSSTDNIEIISDEEKKDLKRSNQKDHKKNKKNVNTPKKSSLGKSKKLDKFQQKSGALTKFLKKRDKEAENDISHDNNSCEIKDEEDYQIISVNKKRHVICLNESSDTQSIKSTLEHVSQVDEKLKNDNITNSITSEEASSFLCQELDSDDAILSSTETLSGLDKSVSSRNEEKSSKLASPTSAKSDKKMKKKVKRLTEKQLERRQEIVQKKEDKLRLKKEKEQKLEEEKANRQRKKEEKQREKEKERMEKELKKQMEMEQKQKEKEAKEEERKKREEEKRKKEEERLEAERKKQKAASNFASFFVPKKQEIKSVEEESVVEAKNFMPFEIKADMRIAPICRRTLNEQEKLLLNEKYNIGMKRSNLYIEDIRKGRIVPRTSSKTWPLEAKDEDILLLDEDNDGSSNIITNTHNLEKHRSKLLQFTENRRPPYWGTWRKRSSVLNPRRPFAKDKKWFDYEVDSDDEWEEEEPGESLKGSDDEKDEENPEDNEYDVDNDFMVPHGYLSDEEARADEEEMEDMSPQTQKMKLKILGEQFEAERNMKTQKLKPKIIGCVWQTAGNSFPETVPTKIKELLSAWQAWANNIPIILPSSTSPESDNLISAAECKTPSQQQSVRGPRKTIFPNEALPDLIRLLHGNIYGRRFLMKEFITFWMKKGESTISKISLFEKISEIASKITCPDEGPMHLKYCWYVPKDIRKQYFPDDEPSLPNRWAYILTPSRKSDTQDVAADKAEKEEKEKEKEKKHVPLITQFTKKITQEEMKKQLKNEKTVKSDQEETKQLAIKPNQIPVAPKLPPPKQKPPKRVALISVGKEEQFPKNLKDSMLTKFVDIKKEEKPSSNKKMKIDDKDDIVFVENVHRKKKKS